MAPDSFQEAQPEKNSAPRPAEWLGLFLMLGGLLLLNLLTYNLYPQVWSDEVWFSEPAVNYVTEGDFHARSFMFVPVHGFPYINCPLYLMVQIPWLAITGTSVLGIRSFNYTLMAVAAFLIWVVSWRFKLVRTPSARLLLVLLLHLGYGMSYAYRCSRPDILGMVCLSLLLLSFTVSDRRWRAAGLLFFSAVTFWIGLQVALFAGFACFLGLLVLRLVRFSEFLVVSVGLACGAASLAVFLWWKGVLASFVPQIVGQLGKRYAHDTLPIGTKIHRVLGNVLVSYMDEFSTDLIIAGIALVLLVNWKKLSPGIRALNAYCLILVFGVPFLFDIAGHWAFYYSYLRFVPASLALFATIGELTQAPIGQRRAWVKPFWLATVGAAIMVGLPMRLALSVSRCHLPPRSEMLQTLRAGIHPGDVALSDQALFFETRQVTTEVYTRFSTAGLFHSFAKGGHDFSPEEKASISVLVIRPQDAKITTNYLGGGWVAEGPPFGESQDFGVLTRLPIVGGRFASYSLQLQNERYPLQIFRRAPEATGAKPQ